MTKYPYLNSRTYYGVGHDVLSDKLDILRAAFPVDKNLDRLDDNDNEVDAEINLLFPFTQVFRSVSSQAREQVGPLFRNGFLLPCWTFAKKTKLMRPLDSTTNFQGCLGTVALGPSVR